MEVVGYGIGEQVNFLSNKIALYYFLWLLADTVFAHLIIDMIKLLISLINKQQKSSRHLSTHMGHSVFL